jgi:hypothetical protein
VPPPVLPVAVVLELLTAVLPAAEAVVDLDLEAGGTEIVLAFPGVGAVVHCHKPSAFTQA